MAHIDWLAVYNYFISSDATTLADCAKKFGIHVDYVRQVAAKQNWTTKKLQVRQTALTLMEQRTANEIAKRNNEHAKIGRAIQGISLEALASSDFKPKSFDEIRKGLETGVKIERVALGLDRKETPSVEIANNKGQVMRISWGDNSPIGDFTQKGEHLELVKSYDSY
jgi:hypothetical protein